MSVGTYGWLDLSIYLSIYQSKIICKSVLLTYMPVCVLMLVCVVFLCIHIYIYIYIYFWMHWDKLIRTTKKNRMCIDEIIIYKTHPIIIYIYIYIYNTIFSSASDAYVTPASLYTFYFVLQELKCTFTVYLSLSPSLSHIYIYIYVCVCVCVCVHEERLRKRQRERVR